MRNYTPSRELIQLDRVEILHGYSLTKNAHEKNLMIVYLFALCFQDEVAPSTAKCLELGDTLNISARGGYRESKNKLVNHALMTTPMECADKKTSKK